MFPNTFDPFPVINLVEVLISFLAGRLEDAVDGARQLEELVKYSSFCAVGLQIRVLLGKILEILKLFAIIVHLYAIVIIFDV